MTRPSTRRVGTVASLAAGGLTALALAWLVDLGTAQPSAGTSPASLEATHLPPLLTADDEVVELRYDAYCVAEEEAEAACDVSGVAHLRQGSSGPFREVPLLEDPRAAEGRWVAVVPSSVGRSPAGFSYYAVLRDTRTGAAVTLPAGGASAPQHSRPLGRPIVIALPDHSFGNAREASARVASAPWGSGAGQVGLEQGRNLTPIGGTSFDVTADRAVHVLDEANGRILRWRAGSSVPDERAVEVNGTLADLALSDDGTAYVLETTAKRGEPVLVRAFDASGRALGATPLAERASQVRMGARGQVLVLQHPSGQWMKAAADGRSLGAGAQRASGRPGRPLPGGGEIVLLRHGSEIRVALVESGSVRQAWRLTSSTPLAEVQLAERLGSRVLVVVRTYADTRDEFRVLVLGRTGLVRAFTVDSADWAESAPLSRFRLLGSSLYHLGSTPSGLFVDRFDLEVE